MDSEHYVSLRRKLEGVRQQVHQNLLQPLIVGDNRRRQITGALDKEGQVFVLCELMELAFELCREIVDGHVGHFDTHHSRFDLREIQNVIDQ